MTNKGIYSVNKCMFHNYSTLREELLFPNGIQCKIYTTMLLIKAPYNFKKKGIKI